MLYFKRFISYITIILVFITSIVFLTGCRTVSNIQAARSLGPLGSYLYYYEGLQNRLYGNINQAIASLYKAISIDSSSSASYYELALCYTSLNDYTSSIHYLKKAIDIEPSNTYYLTYITALFITLEEYSQAKLYQEQLVSIDSSLDNRIQLGLIYSQLQLFDKAIPYFESIAIEFGFLPKVSESLARLYYQIQDFESSHAELRKLTSVVTDNPIFYLLESDLHFQQGYDSLGFESIEKSLSIDPDFPYSHIELFERKRDIGDIPGSLKALKNIVSNESIHPIEKVRIFYPILFESIYYNQYPLHLDTLISTLIKSYPNQPEVFDLAFDHLIRRGDHSSARLILARLLLLDPNNPYRWETAISMDFSLKMFDDAIVLANTAKELFPDYYPIYVYKSIIYQEKNKLDSSEIALKIGLKNTKNDNEAQSELYGMLGDLYYSKGKTRNSFRMYQQSLKSNPDNSRILNNYSYYLALQNRNLDEALRMSKRAVELDPNNSSFIDTKGWILFQMGRYDEARVTLMNALAKSGSNSAIILEHYGDALYKTGNAENARIYWRKARELGEGSPQLDLKIQTGQYVE